MVWTLDGWKVGGLRKSAWGVWMKMGGLVKSGWVIWGKMGGLGNGNEHRVYWDQQVSYVKAL